MLWLCLLLIPGAFAIASPLTWLMRRWGVRLGQVDNPGHRKVHERPIPATGGVAIFAAVVGPIVVGLGLVWVVPAELWERVAPALVVHLEGIREMTPLALGIVAATAGLHAMGLVDDRRALGPWVKLGGQVVAAAVVVLLGLRMLTVAGPIVSAAVTVLWLLTITNAMNFLDNMDGLAGGVGLICGGIFLAAALVGGQWFVAAVLALLVGALAGFLVFNAPPASIFMGDGGSLVVGFVLGLCSIRLTYYDPAEGTHWWAVLTPLVVLAIPLYDLGSVTLIRLRQGRSPLEGDTQHFSHRLVRKGLSKPAAVTVIWACAAATGLGGVMLGRLAGWQAGLVVAQTLLILLVLALLERSGAGNGER